jgi:hypothetical protein
MERESSSGWSNRGSKGGVSSSSSSFLAPGERLGGIVWEGELHRGAAPETLYLPLGAAAVA